MNLSTHKHLFKTKIILSQLLVTLILCSTCFITSAQLSKESETNFNRKIYKLSEYFYVGGYANGAVSLFQQEGVNSGFNAKFDKAGLILQLNFPDGLQFFSETEYNFKDEKIHFTNLFISYKPFKALGTRVGFINIPIGHFNRYHIIADKSFLNEPMLSTELLPSVFSDAGFGIFGTLGKREDCQFKYEINLIEGIGEQILYTPSANTEMQLSKNNNLILNDNNKNLMLNGRFAFLEDDIYEIGASFLTGKYSNKDADTTRLLKIYALDFMLRQGKLKIQSEAALNLIEIPYNMNELYANKQWGTYVDATYVAWTSNNKKLKNPMTLDVSFRYDFVDLNSGYFNRTREKITNEYYKITGGIIFRPIPKSAIILNGSFQWFYDLLGNPAKKSSGLELGIASYF